jgi:rod shape-determining protein MreD
MRPLAYVILAYVAIALQIGLGPHITWHGVPPNLVLLAAVFIGMNAPRNPALFGCFLLGLMQDLLTGQALGVYAFSYGLAALVVTGSAPVMYRDHPLAHVSLVLVAGVIALFAVLISGAIHPAAPAATTDADVAIPATRAAIGPEFRRLVYTAMLAPFVLWGLGRIRRTFAFQGSYRKRGKYR